VSARAVFGRRISYGSHAGCGCCSHTARLLGRLVDSLGRTHITDVCLHCGARTPPISQRDLEAAGIDWTVIPIVQNNAGLPL
jgi:hypothetical protein